MPKIGDAPNGENSSLAGTEKVPLTGSKWAYISTIKNYVKTITDTLYSAFNHTHADSDHGGVVNHTVLTNAGTSLHVPTYSSDSTTYLNGNGEWTIPPGGLSFVYDSDILFSDITTNNADSDHHGFLPKLDGDSAHYLSGLGTWTTPSDSAKLNNDGWIAGTGTWSYSSADSPTFIISINADVTALIGIGDRIKLTQTTTKYFIVTVVGAYSGGNTLVTVYGGTDYTLANAAITNPFYSHSKSPFGFPTSPAKWTVTFTDTSDQSQASPTQNTWYNLGSLSFSFPLGLWYVEWQGLIGAGANSTQVGCQATLSTANNTESDNGFTSKAAQWGATSAALVCYNATYKKKLLSLASKTTYYFNMRTQYTGSTSIVLNNATDFPLVINLICAYL